MQQVNPIVKDLVLIGGGHSHAIVLKLLGMNPIEGVRITLITDTSHTPYSGMLPAHVAGFYTFDETHIDLRRLAKFAQAQLYLDQAIGLDLNNNQVICAHHPPVSFDYLSIDIGSTPATSTVPGATKYAIPSKPVPQFLQAWYQLLEEINEGDNLCLNNFRSPLDPPLKRGVESTLKPCLSPPIPPFERGGNLTENHCLKISIVGGGAGGVELALNMQTNLLQKLAVNKLEINIFHREKELLSGHNNWVSKRLEQILVERGVKLYLGENVSEVLADKVVCESGLSVESNYVFWVTQASAPEWIELSGLATDKRGFILVEDTLQSSSHPHVFAAGDIATMINYSRPKAGVFAVRQGKPLWENLTRFIRGEKLKQYHPQKRYLSLIGTGDKRAIASWSFLGWESPLLWLWKDHIDRKFMRRFRDLPVMEGKPSSNPSHPPQTPFKIPPNPPEKKQRNARPLSPPLTKGGKGGDKGGGERLRGNIYPRCAGCGSKVGSTVLSRVLQRLEIRENQDILVGINNPDDAAVVQVPTGKLMVHTVDYFRSLINDPFVFGKIATNHCLSDIYAMGATPQSALAMVTIPYGKEDKIAEILYQLLSGAIEALQTVPLIGGHTTEGSDLAFGLACNGLVNPEKILRKNGMKLGDVLIVNKVLGTGTLFAAEMSLAAKGRWIDGAVESMLLSNETASKIFLEHGATACTDITGFGLLGHLLEMILASKVRVELDLNTIPILTGAMTTIEAGFTSSLQPQNLQAASYISNLEEVSNKPQFQLLFDPQTSGGLLATIPQAKADSCLNSLLASGYPNSSIIGKVMAENAEKQPLFVKY